MPQSLACRLLTPPSLSQRTLRIGFHKASGTETPNQTGGSNNTRKSGTLHILHKSLSSYRLARKQPPILRSSHLIQREILTWHLHGVISAEIGENIRSKYVRTRFSVGSCDFRRWNTVKESRGCPLTTSVSNLCALTVEDLARILIAEHIATFLVRLFVQLETAKGKLALGDGGGKAGFHRIP